MKKIILLSLLAGVTLCHANQPLQLTLEEVHEIAKTKTTYRYLSTTERAVITALARELPRRQWSQSLARCFRRVHAGHSCIRAPR